jgi:hypothetical protein
MTEAEAGALVRVAAVMRSEAAGLGEASRIGAELAAFAARLVRAVERRPVPRLYLAEHPRA